MYKEALSDKTRAGKAGKIVAGLTGATALAAGARHLYNKEDK